MRALFRWSCLLGFALLAPAALPAGGGERHLPLIRRREASDPLIAKDGCSIFVSPFAVAPPLRQLKDGTPLKVLRSWQDQDGSFWLYVQVLSKKADFLNTSCGRGWLNA